MAQIILKLSLLTERFAVSRLSPQAEIPVWATQGPFFSITQTAEELSIVCPETLIPPDVKTETGWRALKFEGLFDFSFIGILVAVAEPLAKAEVSIFAISTFDTDYVLIREIQLERALSVLRESGHDITSLGALTGK